MKNLISIFLLSFIIFSCNDDNDSVQETPITVYEEIIAVANRASSSISLIDANSNRVLNTISITGSEPMYIVYSQSKNKLYVGDRAAKKIHVINPSTKTVETSITVGNGVFHMWADGAGNKLWVNNDSDNTISVIDLNTNTVIQTINIGMKPHDVFVTKDGTKAYVSVFNSDATMPDKIFLYNATTYAKVTEANVGKDPHLFHLPTSNKLYVPCQSGQIYTLNGDDLSQISNTNFVGAHGIFASANQSTLFVTNISGAQLYSVNPTNTTINGTALSTSVSTPHNIVINEAGNKLFVSHSGATANKVTVYSINGTSLSASGTIDVGTNPFGIAYYKRKI
ncbi:MAG: YncE family protein [Limnohabitans sp.]|nr:YncE family protein [Limnohabitans sp.]